MLYSFGYLIVRFPSNIVFNIVRQSYCSQVCSEQQCCIDVRLATAFNIVGRAHVYWAQFVLSVSFVYIYLLRVLPRECPSYSTTNEHSFQSLDEESSNTCDVFSSRKKKGKCKAAIETVRPGKNWEKMTWRGSRKTYQALSIFSATKIN